MGKDKGIVMDGRDIGTTVFLMRNSKYMSQQVPKFVPSADMMS